MEELRAKPRVLRALRSVMLAGAGAVVWMALSSTAANADSGNSNSLLDGAASTATSVVKAAEAGLTGSAVPAPAVPVPAALPIHPQVPQMPGSRVPAPQVAIPQVPLPQVPVAEGTRAVERELPQLIRTVDDVVAGTPVINAVVPEGTLGAVTEPVVSPAAGAVGGLVADVVSPVVGDLPVTVPGLVLPSIQVPDEPGATPVPRVAPGTGPLDVGDGTLLVPASVTGTAPSIDPSAWASPALWTIAARSMGHHAPAPPNSSSDRTFPPGTPNGDVGVSSESASTNPSGGAPAWLPEVSLYRPSGGPLAPTPAPGRSPAPVSFDPGSSPD
ncbi:hypothetical protein AB6813_10155 [bacterium RCC_150]